VAGPLRVLDSIQTWGYLGSKVTGMMRGWVRVAPVMAAGGGVLSSAADFWAVCQVST